MYHKHNSIRERLLIVIDTEFKKDKEKKKVFQSKAQTINEEIYIEFIESYSGLRTETIEDSDQKTIIPHAQSSKRLSETSASTCASGYANSIPETGEIKRKKSLKLLKSLSYKNPRKVIHKNKSAQISSNGSNLLERFTQFSLSDIEKTI